MSTSKTSSLSFMASECITDFHDPQTFHDRVVIVDEKKFYIQSGLLSVWSEFFRGLFNSEFKEKKEDEVKVEDVSAEEFETFLRLVYGELFKWKGPHYGPLLRLSHRFLAPKVLTSCSKQIEVDFDKIKNKAALLDLACTYELHSVKKRVLEFIEANDDFRILPSLAEVAFKHNLEQLEELIRKRDAQYYEVNSDDDIKENPTLPKKLKLSGVDLEREKTKLAKYQSHEYSNISMKLQNGGIAELKISNISGGKLNKSYNNILFSEGVELIKALQPKYLTMENADADDAAKCWNQLKDMFSWNLSGATFKLVGHGDMWDYNIRILGDTLSKVIAEMMQKATDSLFIKVSKTALSLLADLPLEPSEERQMPDAVKFEIEFLGGWNMPTCYGTLFPIMLKDVKNINQLNISFDLPCKNCVEWIFKHMNWTFDENSVIRKIRHLSGLVTG